MRIKSLPDVALIKKWVRYDPATGMLYWQIGADPDPLWVKYYAGRPVNKYTHSGYFTVRIEGKRYSAHRIIWKLMTGADPRGVVDHINGDRHDNRWSNLRDVDPRVNAANSERGRWKRILRERLKKAEEAEALERAERKRLADERAFQRYLRLKARFEPDEASAPSPPDAAPADA